MKPINKYHWPQDLWIEYEGKVQWIRHGQAYIAGTVLQTLADGETREHSCNSIHGPQGLIEGQKVKMKTNLRECYRKEEKE